MPRRSELRAHGQRRSTVVAVGLVAAVALFAGLQAWTDAPWALSVISAAVVAALPLGWTVWTTRQARRARIENVATGISGVSDTTRLPTAGQVGDDQLRIHRPVVTIPYIPRPAKEAELAAHLAENRPVLVEGPSMVGKTRLAAEVVRSRYQDLPVVIPDNSEAIHGLLEERIRLEHCIVWLDDIERFLDTLGRGLIERLARTNKIIGTIRSSNWDQLQPTDALRPPAWDVLGLFSVVRIDRVNDRPDTGTVDALVSDPDMRDRIQRYGVAEYVGGTRIVDEKLRSGRDANPLGYSLVEGAADWHQAGIARPVPKHVLPVLAAARLDPRLRAVLDRPDAFDAAEAWAIADINPAISLLESYDDHYRVNDYALDQILTRREHIPEQSWGVVIDSATSAELADVGFQAEVRYHLRDVAGRAWRRAADAGNTDAMFSLGVVTSEVLSNDLTPEGEAEAEAWFRKAAEAGHAGAMHNLGIMLMTRLKDVEPARPWLRRAAEAGHTGAMWAFGMLEGHSDEPDSWIRRAAEAGDTGAMGIFALHLDAKGKPDEAESWYVEAARNGDANAMKNLAERYDGRGQREAADIMYGAAAEAMLIRFARPQFRPNPGPLCELGRVLLDRGMDSQGRTLLWAAAEANDPTAMVYVGQFCADGGDHDQAESWYRRANAEFGKLADSGNTDAMVNLALLQRLRGDDERTEFWYRRAAEAGRADVMLDTAVFALKRGDLAQGEHWLRRAAHGGVPDAMSMLGMLLVTQGQQEEAETWLRRAAEAGDASGMTHLGLLLVDQNADEAEHWLRRGADAGDANAMTYLAQLLRQRGLTGESDDWARKAADTQDGS